MGSGTACEALRCAPVGSAFADPASVRRTWPQAPRVVQVYVCGHTVACRHIYDFLKAGK